MSRYAQNTSVSVAKSVGEIQRTIQKYGADEFGHLEKAGYACILFTMKGFPIKIGLQLPLKTDPQFHKTPKRRNSRTAEQAHDAWEQACRSQWRVLALLVKAKLEAVENGIVSFEKEFFADVMLPDGQTVAEWGLPQVEEALKNRKMPPLLPYSPAPLVRERITDEPRRPRKSQS